MAAAPRGPVIPDSGQTQNNQTYTDIISEGLPGTELTARGHSSGMCLRQKSNFKRQYLHTPLPTDAEN